MTRTIRFSLIALVIGAFCGVAVHRLGVTDPMAQTAAGSAGYLTIDYLVLRPLKWGMADHDVEQDQHVQGHDVMSTEAPDI